jgi:hypothetical protein
LSAVISELGAWIDVKTAAEILSLSPISVVVTRQRLQGEGCWSIEWRPNSANLAVQDARAVGLLLLRADVERVAHIRRRCGCSFSMAVRIYDAIANGGAL